MIFPPIFAYVIFFILDLLAFIFDLFVVTAPAGIAISFLATIAYFAWVLMRYGPSKMSEKLFNWRKGKALKKLIKTVGGSVVPFVNVWAVYDDYKEELEEKKKKELEAEGVIKEEKQGLSLKQKVALGAAAVATGGAALAAEGAIAGEAIAGEAAASGALEAGAVRSAATKEAASSRWIKSTGSGINKNIQKKTISEEVGGIKTGLERSDYDDGLTDFSKPETYEKLIRDRAQDKLEEERKRKEIEDTELVKRKKEEVEKRNAFDKEFIRRFGTASYERMKRDREISGASNNPSLEGEDKDKYREIL